MIHCRKYAKILQNRRATPEPWKDAFKEALRPRQKKFIIKNMKQQTNIHQHLPGPIAILRETFEIYKTKWRELAVCFLASFVSLFLVLFMSAFAIHSLNIFANAGLFASAAVIFIMLAAFAIAFLWPQVLISIILKDRQDKTDIAKISARAKSKIIPYIAAIAILMPIFFMGLFFYALPLLFFWIWFLFAGNIATLEKEKGAAAIAKSRSYARGYFWEIFLRASFAVLLLMAGAMVMEITASVLPANFRSIVSGTATLFFLLPLFSIYNYLIFEKIKRIKGELPSPTNLIFVKTLFALGIVLIALHIYFAPQIKEQFDLEILKYQVETGQELPPLPI